MSGKDKPVETSSKVPVSWRRTVVQQRNPSRRDPRFSDDKAVGGCNLEKFQENYVFLEEMREKERRELARQLKRESDPERRSQISYLIQRMDNQRKSKEAQKKQKERKEKLIESSCSAAAAGGGATGKKHYVNKGELKKMELVEKYKELKKSSKLERYIEKKRKRNAQKDKKKLFKNKS